MCEERKRQQSNSLKDGHVKKRIPVKEAMCEMMADFEERCDIISAASWILGSWDMSEIQVYLLCR